MSDELMKYNITFYLICTKTDSSVNFDLTFDESSLESAFQDLLKRVDCDDALFLASYCGLIIGEHQGSIRDLCKNPQEFLQNIVIEIKEFNEEMRKDNICYSDSISEDKRIYK